MNILSLCRCGRLPDVSVLRPVSVLIAKRFMAILTIYLYRIPVTIPLDLLFLYFIHGFSSDAFKVCVKPEGRTIPFIDRIASRGGVHAIFSLYNIMIESSCNLCVEIRSHESLINLDLCIRVIPFACRTAMAGYQHNTNNDPHCDLSNIYCHCTEPQQIVFLSKQI